MSKLTEAFFVDVSIHINLLFRLFYLFCFSKMPFYSDKHFFEKVTFHDVPHVSG